MIEQIYQYGDQTQLKVKLNAERLLKELSQFNDNWSQYNELKPWIQRQGLCILNERGQTGPGPALNSIHEWNTKHNTNYTEFSFNKPTEVYKASTEIQNVFKDILPYSFRSHFLKLKPGGFFPPHRDHKGQNQNLFRLIIPIVNCNPSSTRFMIEDRTLHWEYGYMYVVNTTKLHTLFNCNTTKDSIWLVINASVCEQMVDFVNDNILIY